MKIVVLDGYTENPGRGKTAPLEKKQQDAFNANQKLSVSVGNRQLLQPYGCPAHPNLSANSKN